LYWCNASPDGPGRRDAKEARIRQIKFSDEGVDELHGTVNADMLVHYAGESL
jgi:hypothetical protein